MQGVKIGENWRDRKSDHRRGYRSRKTTRSSESEAKVPEQDENRISTAEDWQRSGRTPSYLTGVQIGKNTAISGVTVPEDYPGGVLESGETLIKAGDRV